MPTPVTASTSSMLADVLGEVPPFFPICMGTFQNLDDGIRLLRLVSKDVGRAALIAIRKIKVRLGDPPALAEDEEEEENGYEDPPDGYYYNKHGDRICPSAAEVSTFMQATSPLQALDITVIIKSGEHVSCFHFQKWELILQDQHHGCHSVTGFCGFLLRLFCNCNRLGGKLTQAVAECVCVCD